MNLLCEVNRGRINSVKNDQCTHFFVGYARFAILAGLSALLIACAAERTVTKKQVKKDVWGRDEKFSVGKDKDGNPVMQSDLRSSMEGKMNYTASGHDFNGRDYTKSSYRKKRWGGNTIFNRKKYGGNTDASRYKNEPWFARKQASASNQSATADGKSYGVNAFNTSNAREQDSKRITYGSDAETDNRRRIFKQPEIKSWRDQTGMSISDTNQKLGR